MGVPEDECHLTFHMFDLNEDLRVDCELEFPFAEDVMKFQALDLNQDGGVDPAQCGDIFTYCDTDVDDLLALPEVLHCEPPPEYAEVSQNYDEQKYNGTAATDPAMGMETYTA